MPPTSKQAWGYTGAQTPATHTGIKGQGPGTRGVIKQSRGCHQPHAAKKTQLQTQEGNGGGFLLMPARVGTQRPREVN